MTTDRHPPTGPFGPSFDPQAQTPQPPTPPAPNPFGTDATVVQQWPPPPPYQVPTSPAAPPPQRGRARLILAILGIIALLAWGITATVIAVQQRGGWTDTKRELADTEADLAATRSQLKATEADLTAMTKARDELQDDVDQLEKDVAALDAQLEETAGDKALAEDEREAFRQLLVIAPNVNSAMRACAGANALVSSALVEFMASYPYGSTYAVDAAIDDSNSICEEAQQLADELEAAIAGVT